MAYTVFDNGALTDINYATETAADSGVVGRVASFLEPVNPGAAADLTKTVTATSGGITNLPATAGRCLVSVEGAAIRWVDNNQTPTATVGHLLTPPSGDATYLMVEGRTRLTNFKMIRAGGTDATVRFTFYL